MGRLPGEAGGGAGRAGTFRRDRRYPPETPDARLARAASPAVGELDRVPRGVHVGRVNRVTHLCVDPRHCVVGPRRGVRGSALDHCADKLRRFDIRYRDSRRHRLGRGFLAFGSRVVVDAATLGAQEEVFDNETPRRRPDLYPNAGTGVERLPSPLPNRARQQADPSRARQQAEGQEGSARTTLRRPDLLTRAARKACAKSARSRLTPVPNAGQVVAVLARHGRGRRRPDARRDVRQRRGDDAGLRRHRLVDTRGDKYWEANYRKPPTTC